MATLATAPRLYGIVLPRRYVAELDSPLTTDRTREAINASVERVSAIPAEVRERLTFREAEVLASILDACSHRQIAERLALSPHSVKTHTRSIYRKLGARDRLEAALAAVRAGWRPSDA